MLPDQLVDSLSVTWEERPGYSGPRLAGHGDELRVLKDFLQTAFWPGLVRFIAPGVLNRHGRVRQQSGFLFPADMDPDDEQFEGVMLFDPLDTIYISDGAFDRLMARYFDTLITGATSHNKPVVAEEWWAEFVDSARKLHERAFAQS